MKVLILGGTGFISSRVVPKLLAAGHNVHVFNRGRTKASLNLESINYIRGNRDNFEDLAAAAVNNYDVVYDFLAYRAEDTLIALKAFKNKTARFIHASTVSVYMISRELTIPITEDQWQAPVMEFWSRNPFGMGYGINKRECENILWNENSVSFPVTMIRPTFVCGPGDPSARDFFWIERIMDEQPLLVPGHGEYKFQSIYVEDAADIFAKVIETEITKGKSYNAADETILTLNSYLELLAEILGKKIELVHCDQKVFDTLPFSSSKSADVFPFNTRTDAVFSLEKVKQDLGYKSTPIKAWMKKTTEWYLKNYKNHSAGYDRRNKELEFIRKLKNQQL